VHGPFSAEGPTAKQGQYGFWEGRSYTSPKRCDQVIEEDEKKNRRIEENRR